MLPLLLLVVAFAPIPEPNEAEQKALAALKADGFRAEVSQDRSKQVKELTFSYLLRDGKIVPVPAKDLAYVADLPNLVQLTMPPQTTVDASLDWIRSADLRDLTLKGTSVTDGGLKKLARLKKLANLSLMNTAIGDDAVKTLASFPALRLINLSSTRVTDKGVKLLEKTQINCLSLVHTAVGDECVASLAKMPNLGLLGLGETKVTDKGMAEITKAGAFPKLQTLGLGSLMVEKTNVTDDTLKLMHDPKVLPALRILGLTGTRATEAGVKALKKARPGVNVIFD